MNGVRQLFGVVAVCALSWVAFTCGGDSGEGNDRPSAESSALQPLRPGGTGPGVEGDPPTGRRETVEALREAIRAARHPSDAGGRAWLEPESTSSVQAGGSGRWILTYEAGPLGIEVGGFLRLTVPYFWWDWSPAQARLPEAPGYTLAECSAAGVELEDRESPQGLEFLVRGRRLEAGERIRITYGAGPAMAQADRYAERDSRFWIAIDGDADGQAWVLSDSPGVDVAAGPAAILSAVLPSTVEPGESFVLRLAFLDATGSRGAEFVGEVKLLARPEGLVLPEAVVFRAEDAGVKQVTLQAGEKGVFRLLARAVDEAGSEKGEYLAQANPLVVEPNVAPIRWGDLHGHSNLSDGTGTPEDFLAYARDVAGLDAVCLTDHDHWGMLPLDQFPELWGRIREATDRAYEPGKFVSVLGYEWTNWIHGHRHVLYFGNEGEVLSSVDERYETPKQLWDALRGKPAMTFAHHSAGGPIATNWDFAPDPVLEPVTEVASVHGASEAPDAPERIYSPLAGNFVRDVLDRGHTLGFIGSGDSHDGHPGLAHLVNPQMGGVAALLTRDLTREGLRQALAERRCYATNGPRIVMRAALEGQRMGSTVAPRAGKALVYVRAIACAPIESIDLVRSGKVVESLPGEHHWDVEAAFEPQDLVAGEYLYVRVVQEDGGAAWSSPFFVR